MRASRSYPRSLLVILLVAGCAAAAIAPVLAPVRAAPVRAPLDHIVISEFRTNIPNGLSPLTDSFVELFNPTGGPLTIGAHWKLERSDCGGSTGIIYDFPAAVPLAAGQHYLIGGQTYSGSVTPDVPAINIGVSNDGGIGLVDSSVSPVIIDGVGMCNTAMFVELPQLRPLTGAFDQSYDRVQDSAGNCSDTNQNADDFFLRSPSDPQSSTSPFTTTTCGDVTHTISGTVTGVTGAVLTYNYFDGPSQKVTAGAGGAYSFTVPDGSTGTVVPSKPGHVFTPPNKAYNNIGADQTQNYSAAPSPPTATPVPGYLSVLINEVAFGGTTYTANDQWIELYNPNPWDITVARWHLTGASGTGGTITLTGVIKANCFLVIERNDTVFERPLPLVNGCRARTLVDTNLRLSTYGASLALSSNTGSLIDTANHDGGPWPAGVQNPDSGIARRSMERHGTADTDTDWYTFVGPPQPPQVVVYDGHHNLVRGTPGEKNWANYVIATPSPVPTKYKTPTAPPPTPFGHMVINEFLPRAGHDYNQDGTVDVYDEFIEVKNLGPISANLSGWKIDVISSAGSSSYSLPSKVLQPDQRAVYYSSVTHISLHDSGGTVRLTNTRGIIIDARGYDPVNNPDQSTCRLPDGYYWRFPCFPTPGNENSQTGIAPIPPPNTGGHPAPCLLADTVPDAFRLAECNGFGSDIFNAKYWDDQSGFSDFPVLDMLNKWLAIVK